MKSIFTLFFLCSLALLNAQSLADFENFSMEPDTFLNGSDGSGGFSSGNIFLANSYDTTFSSWSGWAISNMRDTLTPGFSNQYSAIAGTGADSSANFAVSFSFGANIIQLDSAAAGKPVAGVFVTNNTYTYLSMKDGDSFAKKFGGVSGDDPDFFLLTIKSYLNGVLSTDSVDFYLADYRFEDNSQDYLLKDWAFVDLSSLGNADSLAFSLSSSDNGQFGMNTPAYFCLDNLGEAVSTGIFSPQLPELAFTVYPNPAVEQIVVTNLQHPGARYTILGMNGELIVKETAVENEEVIDIRQLPQGTYLIRVMDNTRSGTRIFVKR